MANPKDDPVAVVVRELPADVVDVLMDHLTDAQLRQLIGDLGEFYTTKGIRVWLTVRQRALGGDRPVGLLRNGQLDVQRVLDYAHRVAAAAVEREAGQ